MAGDETLRRIGSKHGALAAQVAIAWLLGQDGVVAIPKTQGTQNQRANLDAVRIVLDNEDRRAMAALPKNQRHVKQPTAALDD
jgi:2,5-diketo-D-gluconate reductase B